MRKIYISIFLILWLEAILLVFYIVQKPDFLSILQGLWNLILVILVPLWMLILSLCMGSYFLKDETPEDKIILGSAIGLGIFGLAGFGLAINGFGKPVIVWGIFITLTGYFIYTKKIFLVWQDVKHLAKELTASLTGIARWIPICIGIGFILAFLMGLTPPIEDFDALLYHLSVPSWWLRAGGISLSPSPHYWFPQIVEGSFVWPLILGVDTAAHLIHFTWLLLTAFLLWHWTHQVWDNPTAWDALVIVFSMPSLLLLASWAYTDYALVFASLASMFSLWRWKNTSKDRWLFIGGIMAGIAVSVKYTGFVVPLVSLLLIMLWKPEFPEWIKKTALFSATMGLIASPWYLRNWIWMKNPIYPFIFSGRFWDVFLAQVYSGAGTGIGLDPIKIFTLPLTATLGIQDRNFFDGRIGPFFLILLPTLFWVFWDAGREKNGRWSALVAIGLFCIISITLWAVGVINSIHLFQTRLLYPALIPAAIPLALGLKSLNKLDTSRLRVGLIVRSWLAVVVIFNLVNFGLFTLIRNPLAVVTGMITRQQYMNIQQPGYASAVELANQIHSDSRIYILFEPRSYGMKAYVEPDVINSHFPHDVWLYASPEKILASWKTQGYSHILIRNITNNEPASETRLLDQTKALMVKIGETPQGEYELFKIP